jgi:hypothetical protein
MVEVLDLKHTCTLFINTMLQNEGRKTNEPGQILMRECPPNN